MASRRSRSTGRRRRRSRSAEPTGPRWEILLPAILVALLIGFGVGRWTAPSAEPDGRVAATDTPEAGDDAQGQQETGDDPWPDLDRNPGEGAGTTTKTKEGDDLPPLEGGGGFPTKEDVQEEASDWSGGVGPCEVIDVIDGDTIRVDYKGREEKIRMLRIDTPEREEHGYQEAGDALRRLVGGREVQIVFEDPGEEARDQPFDGRRLGRLLAYVVLDGRNINIEMVRQGWSTFWTKYGAGRFASEFEAAEREARSGNRGLWTDRGWNRGR